MITTSTVPATDVLIMEGTTVHLIVRAALPGLALATLLAAATTSLAGAAPLAATTPLTVTTPLTATTSSAAAVSGSRAVADDCRPEHRPRSGQELDGFRLGRLPHRIGSLVTDFASEWEGTEFTTRVWESGPDADGGYRVDLQVVIMRNPAFTDPAAVKAFLTDWLERDPAGWPTVGFDHPDGPGFSDADEFVWLAEPGTAVRVAGYGESVGPRELHRTACAVRRSVQR